MFEHHDRPCEPEASLDETNLVVTFCRAATVPSTRSSSAVRIRMIDRIVHHAEVITLKGGSHRLRNTGIDTLPSARVTVSTPPGPRLTA